MNRCAIALVVVLVAAVATEPAAADHGLPEIVSVGPAGGNGATDAGGGRLSPDGNHAFFTTREQLVVADTDSSVDLYERTGSTTTLVSAGTTGGNAAFDATFLRASMDGSVVAFSTAEQLVAADTDAKADIYTRSGGTTQLVSSGPTDAGQYEPFFQDMSPEGAHIAFTTRDTLTTDDTDSSVDVYERHAGATTLVSTGPVAGVGEASNARFAQSGFRVFFATSAGLVGGDTDAAEDIYERSGGTTTLATPGIDECHTVSFQHFCFGARLDDVSDDGNRIIFESEAYVADDDDFCSVDDDEELIGCGDIFERSGGTYRRVSTGTTGGGDDFGHVFVSASADASYVLFQTFENLQPSDTDLAYDAYVWHAGATTHVSANQGGTPAEINLECCESKLSSDGLRAFFATREKPSCPLIPTPRPTCTSTRTALASSSCQLRPGPATGLRMPPSARSRLTVRVPSSTRPSRSPRRTPTRGATSTSASSPPAQI